MAAFIDGLTAIRNFNDCDAMATALTPWAVTFDPFVVSGFAGRIEIASTPGLLLTHFAFTTSLLATGIHPCGSVTIGLPISAAGNLRSRGRAIDTTTIGLGQMPGDAFHFLTLGPLDLVAASLDEDLFARHLRDRFGLDPAALGSDWWLRTPPGTADCMQRGRALLALQSVLLSGGAVSPEARRRLEECALQILLDGFDADGSARRELEPLRRGLARRVEEILRAQLDDPPSLGELCGLVGASERTLHMAFHEAFGMPPKSYLRALRLGAARRRLRRGEGPVTTVAADLGLFHFGRFSTEYRALFGENPSETLRRARGGATS